MKEKILIICFLLSSVSYTAHADSQVNVSDLTKEIPVDNIVKIYNECGDEIKSKPSIISKITQSHNLQKKYDVDHEENVINATLKTKVTKTLTDGTIIVTETEPSNVTLETISQRKDNFAQLENGASKLGLALLLFKSLGGL